MISASEPNCDTAQHLTKTYPRSRCLCSRRRIVSQLTPSVGAPLARTQGP